MAKRSARPDFDALERATDIVHRAWEASSAKKRVELAKKALAVSPLCADAYVILAEHAKAGSDDELDLWRKGVAAGEAAIGKRGFEEDAGYFWGLLETRPYMRARRGLALALWRRGQKAEAAAHLRDMLHLNPGDNQGVRYVLAGWLLDMDEPDELAALLKQFEEDGMAEWTWTAALAAFRKGADSAEARAALATAIASNAHVAPYLLGAARLPRTLPLFISPGRPDEAMHYAANSAYLWEKTSGALDWLRSNLPHTAGPEPAKPKRSNRKA
jgi:tetratricopeptide (TPR) repeat protein